MLKKDYKLWINYHNGKINRKLTEREFSEIRACEFAMHLLVPTDSLLEFCGGYDKMRSIYVGDFLFKLHFINKLAKIYNVPAEAVLFKMQYEILNHDYKNVNDQKINKDEKSKILKRVKNVVYVDFR